MRTILVRNVEEALSEGFWHLKTSGVEVDSRNGKAVVAPGPVITCYMRPTERVLFHPKRDANPTFHLLEALWMMGGFNDAEMLKPFNSRITTYAEDDLLMHGAYGFRWRRGLQIDQVWAIIDLLRADPRTRRAVLQMWDCRLDLGANKRDLPCNTHIYFNLDPYGNLDMTVCNRSNDILWGAYGANAVHMSVLHELIAVGARLPVGRYYQVSNNYHAYPGVPMVEEFLRVPPAPVRKYAYGEVDATSLIEPNENLGDFLADCYRMFREKSPEYVTKFFREVAEPMRMYYLARPDDQFRFDKGSRCDWHVAYNEWAERRQPV